MPALLILSLLAFGCDPGGGGDLLFTERSDSSPQAEAEDENPAEGTVRSNVELDDQQQMGKKLLILPFTNATRSSELDTLIGGVPLIIKRIFDNDRFVSAESVEHSVFDSITARAGLSPGEIPSMEIARLFRESHNADVILCGRIMMDQNNLIIEPKIYAFNGEGATEEELPQMEVRTRNFLNIFDPLTERIRDYLVELQ